MQEFYCVTRNINKNSPVKLTGMLDYIVMEKSS